jgi:integrase
VTRPAGRTLGELVEHYLTEKAHVGKRSLKDDTRICQTRLLPAFGATRPLRTFTKADIGEYKTRRLGEVTAYTVSNELSVLRHMLNMARDEWGWLEAVPRIKLPKKPEGRLRYLEADEIGKLVDACRQSRNRCLACVVTIAIHTGMRKGEILGLEWERRGPVEFPGHARPQQER